MVRRDVLLLLAAFGVASLVADALWVAGRLRLRAWDAGFTAGTRAAGVLRRLGAEEGVS